LSKDHWKLWTKAIQDEFEKAYSERGTQHQLRQPLGAWLEDPALTAHWFYNLSSYKLYRHTPRGWQVYKSIRGTGRTGGTFAKTNVELPNLPGGSKPATISTHSRAPNQVTLHLYSTDPVLAPGPTPNPSTLKEHLDSLDAPSKWAVATMDLGPGTPSQQGADIAAAIMQGTCKAVTDGSYKLHHGTASFVIKGLDPRKTIQGSNVTPGQPSEQCAYRSKLGGILGILTVLESICAQYNITEG
jgi:hypothetical protein